MHTHWQVWLYYRHTLTSVATQIEKFGPSLSMRSFFAVYIYTKCIWCVSNCCGLGHSGAYLALLQAFCFPCLSPSLLLLLLLLPFSPLSLPPLLLTLTTYHSDHLPTINTHPTPCYPPLLPHFLRISTKILTPHITMPAQITLIRLMITWFTPPIITPLITSRFIHQNIPLVTLPFVLWIRIVINHHCDPIVSPLLFLLPSMSPLAPLSPLLTPLPLLLLLLFSLPLPIPAPPFFPGAMCRHFPQPSIIIILVLLANQVRLILDCSALSTIIWSNTVYKTSVAYIQRTRQDFITSLSKLMLTPGYVILHLS